MNTFGICISFILGVLTCTEGLAQTVVYNKHGLDSVFVEVYYRAAPDDIADDASGDRLDTNAVTYRIYVDMKEGYKMQMLYGLDNHPLEIRSTKKFHNSQFAGRTLGSDMPAANLKRNIMALDSWITIGSASNEHVGVLKSLDTDGSVLGGKRNDGGTRKVASGLLANEHPDAGIPLTLADGLLRSDTLPSVRPVFFQLHNLDIFNDKENDGVFLLNDAAWAVLDGVAGSTVENQVLVAQITTSGELSYKLNFQLIAPYGGVERFFAEHPDEIDFTHPSLIRSPNAE